MRYAYGTRRTCESCLHRQKFGQNAGAACDICGKDISERNGNAIYCVPCSKGRYD